MKRFFEGALQVNEEKGLDLRHNFVSDSIPNYAALLPKVVPHAC